MITQKIDVDINERFKLVCELGVRPYEKELNVYVEDKVACDYQDIARISPEYDLDDDCNVTYEEGMISLKIFADKDKEDFTAERFIPIRFAEEEFTVSEIMKLEKLELEQNVHNVLQCESVLLGQFVSDGKVNLEDCKNFSYRPVMDYDAAYFDYNLKHKGKVVLECASTEEVEEYINKILAKYNIRK